MYHYLQSIKIQKPINLQKNVLHTGQRTHWPQKPSSAPQVTRNYRLEELVTNHARSQYDLGLAMTGTPGTEPTSGVQGGNPPPNNTLPLAFRKDCTYPLTCSFSLSSTCHPLKLNIILASQKRTMKYRDEKRCTDLNLHVPKEGQTVLAKSGLIKHITGKQS